MTELYLVRHGETEINRRNAFNGGLSDTPLTENGVAGAKHLGDALAATHFTQVITSSMPRAVTTTDLLMAPNHFRAQTPITPVAGLREMILGDWEGLTVEEVADPERTDIYFTDPVRYDREIAAAIQAETYAAVRSRARAVIDAAVAAHPTGKLLIVAHGLVFQVLVNDLLGHPLANLRKERLLQNTTVTKLVTRTGTDFELVYRDCGAHELAEIS